MSDEDPKLAVPGGTETPDSRTIITRALKSGRRNQFRTGVILGSIVTVAAVLLIIQNGESAQLDWLFFHFRTPLWIMLVLTAVAGAVGWELIKIGSHRARRVRAERREALQAHQTANREEHPSPL